jgi:hypothetical protein
MIGIGVSIWSLTGCGDGAPPVINTYLRPGSVFLFLRPDGTSIYTRP